MIYWEKKRREIGRRRARKKERERWDEIPSGNPFVSSSPSTPLMSCPFNPPALIPPPLTLFREAGWKNFFFFSPCAPCFLPVLVWVCIWALVVFMSVLLLPLSPTLCWTWGGEYFYEHCLFPSCHSCSIIPTIFGWIVHSRQPQLFFLGIKSDRPVKIIYPRLISLEAPRYQWVKYKLNSFTQFGKSLNIDFFFFSFFFCVCVVQWGWRWISSYIQT